MILPLSITGKTQIYGIIGYPIAHTFSPPLQNAAFQAIQIDAAYLPFEVHPKKLKAAIAGIKSLQIRGINVTVPHKVHVVPFLDEVTPTAQRIGAVNTILNNHGRLIGTNTDGQGFIRSLSELPFTPQDKTIVILGAGGSTRSIVVALAEANAKQIFLVNRTIAKAKHLVEEFSPVFPQTQLRAEQIENLYSLPIDLFVNTTSVGMEGDKSPADLNQFKILHYVADIIYTPQQTALLKQAKQLNIPFINGLGMLLYQGCEAFEFWTQQSAPTALMKTTLMKLLN
ncbi:MAG: shikimate dehydrogenase [SAR324 cluster bacterium]|nr:shikimate dehydrogenase [SAR324 cluster bacterium]